MLLAAALVVGGGAYAYAGYRDSEGADGAVRGYLHALARGDAPAALSYGTVPAGSHAFLTSSVLKQQLRLAPMRDITIGGDVAAGTGTRVPFSYNLAFGRGELHVDDAVVVTKVDGHWRLATVVANVQLQLAGAQNRTSLAGAAVPAGAVLLFPGALPIDFDTPYLQVSQADEAVSLNHPIGYVVGVELTKAGQSIVTQHLTTLLTACGRGGAGAVARCPVPSAEFVPGSMSGTLRSNPSSLSLDVDTSADGLIDVTGIASFTGTYRELDFDDVSHTRKGTVSVPFSATGYAVAPLTIALTVPAQ